MLVNFKKKMLSNSIEMRIKILSAIIFCKFLCFKIIQMSDEIFKLTPSHDEGHWMVTGTCLTVPLPKASLFLWAENNLSSFFSSSLKLLQYLFERNSRCRTFEYCLQIYWIYGPI